jgi:hypothetical protein
MALREAATAAVVVVPFGLGLSAGATTDDPEPVFRFQDPAIVESSGLVVLPDGRFVTVNDSGDESRVFTVDPASGKTVGVTRWEGRPTTWRRWHRPAREPSGSATSVTTTRSARPWRRCACPSARASERCRATASP